MRGRPRGSSALKGIFPTHKELEAAVVASRQAGERVVDAAPRLGITVPQYNNIIRRYTRTGAVPRMRERGAFIVRRLGNSPVFFTPAEVEALLAHLNLLKLPPDVEATVARLRELAERKEERRKTRQLTK